MGAGKPTFSVAVAKASNDGQGGDDMTIKPKVLDFRPSEAAEDTQKQMQLASGRRIVVEASGKDDLIEILDPGGTLNVAVRLTEEGPVISVRGTRLELKAVETMTLEAKRIHIAAEEETIVKSHGKMDLDSSREMSIQSDDDIRVSGKIIHLN
jgi:hypothetical protein